MRSAVKTMTEDRYKEKCNAALNQLKLAFQQLLQSSIDQNTEQGAQICRDKATGKKYTLGSTFTGELYGVKIEEECPEGFAPVGTFHTHVRAAAHLSQDDILHILQENEEITCIGSKPSSELYPPLDKYKNAEVLKCYINNRRHPLFRTLKTRMQGKPVGTKIPLFESEEKFVKIGWNDRLHEETPSLAEKGFHTFCESFEY